MALIEQTVYVSVKDNGIEPRLYMVQADTGRTIRCVVQDWDIPSGASAKVYVRKISGKVVYNICEVDNSTNSVLIDVTNQMIAEAGADNLAIVEIASGDECVTTFAFFLVVKYKFGSEEESKNESTWVDELMQKYIDEATALVKDAQDAAEEADSAADSAKESATEVASSAEQAKNAMNTATDAADRAEKAAASAATSEADAAASAKEAGESADAVLAESEKIDERLDRAEGLIDATLQAADDASASAASASASAEEAKSEADRAKEYADDASKYSLVDISDKEVTFEEAEEREDLESGDTVAILFGKIKKWFSDLGDGAFSGSDGSANTECVFDTLGVCSLGFADIPSSDNLFTTTIELDEPIIGNCPEVIIQEYETYAEDGGLLDFPQFMQQTYDCFIEAVNPSCMFFNENSGEFQTKDGVMCTLSRYTNEEVDNSYVSYKSGYQIEYLPKFFANMAKGSAVGWTIGDVFVIYAYINVIFKRK